jgi:hypothetical protein
MKRSFKLIIVCLSLAGLASCSTLGLGNSNDTANKDQQENTDASTVTSSDASSSAVTKPTAKISLKENNQKQIIATVYTTYNNNPQGSVSLQWKAPKGSKCYDTSFPITKYGETKDKTWASVEIKQGGKYCHGKWTANVLYKDDVIASDSLTV